jgi:CheY-like chemotaxis protein
MEVFEAADGLEAFERCKKQVFDVILMDLQMPVMDGYEATEKILEWERNHGRFTPILAVTAETLDDVRLKIRKAGMIDVVTKPFKPDNLFKTINAAVRIKE